MKKTKLLFTFLLLVGFIVSCEEDEYVTSYSDGSVVYERINDKQAVVNKSLCVSTNITIPDSIPMGDAKVGVVSINDRAFEGDTKIQNINYSRLISKIGDYAFAASSLRSFTIKGTVSSIGVGICEDCLSLTNVNIEKGILSTIPEDAFSVDWEANTKNSALNTLIIPEGIKTIGKRAFWRTNAKRIDIPNSVERIEQGAFCYTGADYITIGTGIKHIGNNAFDRAGAYYIVIYANSVPEIGNEAFNMIYNPIYVKDELVDAWKKVLPFYADVRPLSSL